MRTVRATTFDTWRDACRRLLAEAVPPADVHFDDGSQPSLFEVEETTSADLPTFAVPKAFVSLAKSVACHRDPLRWHWLYEALWRLTHGEPHLLDLASDPVVRRLTECEKSVRRDAHKMKAFVRFRRVETDGEEHFVAWHRPDHFVLRTTAPFFSRRFPEMRWSILTPDESVSWDGDRLEYGPGVPASQAPEPDQLEAMWKTYYGSTFNPARIKLKAMKRELPVRHWPTLPETAMIPQLLADASNRVDRMIAYQEGSATNAADFIPATGELSVLRDAAMRCRGCDLCLHATQTVFGEGPPDARLVLVGEQPADNEDLAGRPFVGPAGEVLDAALREAGIDRSAVYVTNAVKHFKFERRGDRRINVNPGVREVTACRPWLVAEMSIVRPAVLVCLGAVAARSVIGRDFRLTDRRGEVLPTAFCERTIATYHPSAILRVPNRAEEMRSAMVADLRVAAEIAANLA